MSLALVCGNSTVWKPALSTNLVSIALTKIISGVLAKHNVDPALASMVTGPAAVGEALCKDPRVRLVSFTGSTAVGRKVGVWVQERFGRSVLELGGNNAISGFRPSAISAPLPSSNPHPRFPTAVMDDANMDLALRGTLFSAIGTSGQRCTTTRRLFVQRASHDAFIESLVHAYRQVRIGDPLDRRTLFGPLHKPESVDLFKATLDQAKKEGGEVVWGGDVLEMPGDLAGGMFVRPAIVRIDPTKPVVQRETFAPILYVSKFKFLDEAIRLNNMVPQGLASALFTSNMSSSFRFTSVVGSDCGIVNVNVPTSAAEVGTAFGGEKESGGGREGGSDSWKVRVLAFRRRARVLTISKQSYMRRVSATINYGGELPPSQAISFHSAQVSATTETAEGQFSEMGEVASALNKLFV